MYKYCRAHRTRPASISPSLHFKERLTYSRGDKPLPSQQQARHQPMVTPEMTTAMLHGDGAVIIVISPSFSPIQPTATSTAMLHHVQLMALQGITHPEFVSFQAVAQSQQSTPPGFDPFQAQAQAVHQRTRS